MAGTEAEYQSDDESTKDTPNLTLTSCGVSFVNICEKNSPLYNLCNEVLTAIAT